MSTKLFKAAACFTWAAVLVSSAAPADATAITTQTGTVATCTPASSTQFNTFYDCTPFEEQQRSIETYYIQQIRFNTVGCNTGGCASESGLVYTDALYGTARKVVYLNDAFQLCSGNTVYELGTCAC